MIFVPRLAFIEDCPALESLINAAITELLKPWLNAEQVAASRGIMGLDTKLIEDRTYFVVECGGHIAACGGWSGRATTFGCGHLPRRDDRLLDPHTEPARIRAMYTHPQFARRGIGRSILAHCERAAAAAGFKRSELIATLAGEPLYAACGYRAVERFSEIAPCGVAVPVVRMIRQFDAVNLPFPI